MEPPASGKGAVTIVVQTRVKPEATDAFVAWQAETGKIIAAPTATYRRSLPLRSIATEPLFSIFAADTANTELIH